MSSAPVGSPKVLIVDAHVDTRDLLTFVFQGAGFSACSAGTVAQALACLRDLGSLPALVVSEIVMPGVSGVEFIHYLSGKAALKHIPVIVLTGAKLTEVPTDARVVFQKPVDPYALVRAAKAMLPVAINDPLYPRPEVVRGH